MSGVDRGKQEMGKEDGKKGEAGRVNQYEVGMKSNKENYNLATQAPKYAIIRKNRTTTVLTNTGVNTGD